MGADAQTRCFLDISIGGEPGMDLASIRCKLGMIWRDPSLGSRSVSFDGWVAPRRLAQGTHFSTGKAASRVAHLTTHRSQYNAPNSGDLNVEAFCVPPPPPADQCAAWIRICCPPERADSCSMYCTCPLVSHGARDGCRCYPWYLYY